MARRNGSRCRGWARWGRPLCVGLLGVLLGGGCGAGDESATKPAPESSGGASSGSTAGLAAEAGALADSGSPDAAAAGLEASDGGTAPGDAGSDGGTSADTGCSSEMARIGRFCVDRWEAHLVTLGPSGAEQIHAHNERPLAAERYQARSAAGVLPQAYISRVESEAACRNAGKRLCTFDEWRRACRGKRGYRYPYGWRFEKERCNVGKPHLLPQFFGADPGRWKYDDHFNSPLLDAEPGYLARSAEYARCGNEEGVLDMVGNLHEWVSGTVTDDFMERLERDDVERNKQPWHLGNGIFLGGFFSTLSEHGPGCLFATVAHEPRYHDYSTGVRCCAAAQGDEASPAKKSRQAPAKLRKKSPPVGAATSASASTGVEGA
jgi:sulfatase modifying factor 1